MTRRMKKSTNFIDDIATPTLTKADIADALYEQVGLNKRESKDLIDAFFALIMESVVEGKDVKISGFGNFQVRTKAARPGRNPRTGEEIPIAPRRVVTFSASQKLRQRMADAVEEHSEQSDASDGEEQTLSIMLSRKNKSRTS